ncbi:MAG: hypothetical protein ABL308_11480 [Oceanicaulis sp.]
MKTLIKSTLLAGAAALSTAVAADAQDSMACSFIAFDRSGNPSITGEATLQRNVSARAGVIGSITAPGEGTLPVTGAWEDGAAVFYLGDEREPFSGREYRARSGGDDWVIAGRSGSGRTPVFFYCREDERAAPPPPEPDPDPRPEPPREEGYAGGLTLAPGLFADLDRPAVEAAFSSRADLVMVATAEEASFVTVGAALTGDPYGFSSMSLERRCENARERGRLSAGAIPEVTLRRDEEVCFVTGEGRLGALIVRSVNPRDAVFDVYLYE